MLSQNSESAGNCENVRGSDRSQYKFSKKWVFIQFYRIKIKGIFRCGDHTWRKMNDDAAIKYLAPHTWGALVMFPRREWVGTFFVHQKPM